MNFKRAALFFCWTLLFMDSCLGQRDCTGVDCPPTDNCLEITLEVGACCPTCTQRGCTCEGYQYYDCIQSGFQKGKVPEGKSYFVDFGSTECSCPQGGGKISCHFIPCPELPPNCIDILQPADGCQQCERIGCTHGSKKYKAGHSFQMDHCQVCHCPNEGGKLMCSLIPGCDLHSANKHVHVATTEGNSHFREISSRPDSSQISPMEPYSKLAVENTLPLFKQDPPGFGTANYDDTLAGPTSSAVQKLAPSLESTTVPAAYPESNSTSFSAHDEQRHDSREPEETGEAAVTHDTGPTATEAQSEPTTVLTTTQEVTTENLRPQEAGERRLKHPLEGTKVLQDPLKDLFHTAHPKHQKPSQATHSRSHASFQIVVEEKESVREQPKLQFSPTSHAPVKIKEGGQDRQPQTRPKSHNYPVQGGDGDTEGTSERRAAGLSDPLRKRFLQIKHGVVIYSV